MVEMAVGKGFTPALVMMWLCFVKDTQTYPPDEEWIMPLELVKTYTEYILSVFLRFDPIYIISGDTNFGSEITVSTYMMILETVKQRFPQSLTSMHIAGNQPDLPDVFSDSPLIDFYMYQSGHDRRDHKNTYRVAMHFYGKRIKRPIINSEPCYEGIFNGENREERFTEYDVRKAMWQSTLSGAKAGFTYGVQGIWMWHKKTTRFMNAHWWGNPFSWNTAYRMKGSWDAGYAKWLFEMYHMYDMILV